jgi:hypothetical protein
LRQSRRCCCWGSTVLARRRSSSSCWVGKTATQVPSSSPAGTLLECTAIHPPAVADSASTHARREGGVMLVDCLSGINIGPEPTTDRFVVVESGLEERRTPGNTLVVQPSKPYQVAAAALALQTYSYGTLMNMFAAAEYGSPAVHHRNWSVTTLYRGWRSMATGSAASSRRRRARTRCWTPSRWWTRRACCPARSSA